MQTGSGGYILVLRDRRSAWAGARLYISRFPGEAWLKRARRLLRRKYRIPPALRLVSCHYADDPARVRTAVAAALGPRFAERMRGRESRLCRALGEALAEDRARREARFDPATGLFRTPGDALPAPVKRLVARLRGEIVAQTSARRRTHAGHLRHPYAVGLVWPLLRAQLEAEDIPRIYGAEMYRALVRALAGCHLTSAEMRATLAAADNQLPEYRIGAWEYRRFARRSASGETPGLSRLAFYLLDPHDHMMRGLADYRRRVHGSVPVRLAIWSFRLLQLAALGVASASIAWLLLRAENGLMPGLTLLFAVGAAIPAGRLYRRPDMARLLGHVSEPALARARAALETVPVRPPVPAAHAARMPPPEAGAQTAPPAGKTGPKAFQPVDIPAPFPVPAAIPAPAARPAVPETRSRPAASALLPDDARVPEAASALRPALSPEDVARAYMATPIGPIPFPVPRGSADAQPRPQAPARATPQPQQRAAGAEDDGPARMQSCVEESGAGIFVLGWGMPIPVPNWMAAREADEPPPAGKRAGESEPARAAERARAAQPVKQAGMFHAPPLPPVLPSAAFWGIEGAGLRAGNDSRPGAGDGSRRRNS